MATRPARAGIDHPTVVPENFDPEEDDESADRPSTGAVEGDADAGSADRDDGTPILGERD